MEKVDEEKPNPVGAPPKYNEEIADRIIFLFSTTPLSMEKILAQLKVEYGEAAPTRVTVWRWQETYEEFRNKLSRARELHGDALFEAAQEESGNVREGLITTTGERGGKKVSETKTVDNVERSKLATHVLLRAAGIYNKKYQEKAILAGDADMPAVIQVKIVGALEEKPKTKK